MPKKPTGKEIAEKRKTVKFDEEKAVKEIKEGKEIKFKPAKLKLEKIEDLEEGQIIGELEHEFEEREGKLPPGKYNIYLAKVDEEWVSYAESDGKIKAETKKVKIEKHAWGEHKHEKPKFKFESVCVGVCLVHFLIWCLVSVRVCFYIGPFCEK